MSFSAVRRAGEQAAKRLAGGLVRLAVRFPAPALLDQRSLRSILVVRQHNQLGDMLCVVPLLRALRGKFPDSRIVLLASPVNYAVMLHHRLLDEVIKYDKREFLGGGRIRPGALWRFLRSLRAQRFDMAIVPATVSMSFTSDLLSFFSGARLRIGPGALAERENPGNFLYTHPVRLGWEGDPGRHQTLRNFDVCRGLGLDAPELDLEITLLPEERKNGSMEIEKLRGGARGVVAFHPGAGKTPNRWPVDSFAQVIGAMSRHDSCGIVIIKGPMDNEPVELLVNSLTVPFYLVEGRPIREVASILASVDLVVSNDTGVMHVAAAVGTRVLSLFGPTDPRQWAPPGPKNRYIACGSGVIAEITVDEVLRAARQMLPEHAPDKRIGQGNDQ